MGYILGRYSGSDFCFPDIASHDGRFRIILARISSVISLRVDIQQLSLFLICRFFCLIKIRILLVPESIRLDTLSC